MIAGRGGKDMGVGIPKSDDDVLDLLRISGALGVSDLADAMEVTQTAVRQRLTRLMGKGIIQREATRHGRGRPRHRYWLTDKGMQLTGSNFNDLAMALWEEVSRNENPEVRREILRRLARALAAGYAERIQGTTPTERMESLAELLSERRIPVSVERSEDGIVLTAHACAYPKLAEKDPEICNLERMMFSELMGHEVDLTECRLKGGAQCRFHAH